jgi:hypothetical protein
MRCPSPSPLPRGPRGQISWVTLLLLTVLGGGGYLGWVYLPLYITDFQAKQVVRDYMNQAVKDRNDDRLREWMVEKLRSIEQVEVRSPDGSVTKVPSIDIAAQDVTWERDTRQPPTLRVAFSYIRIVRFPWLERQTEKVFSIDLTQDISVPDWGPSR